LLTVSVTSNEIHTLSVVLFYDSLSTAKVYTQSNAVEGSIPDLL